MHLQSNPSPSPESRQDKIVFALVALMMVGSMGMMVYRVNNFLTFFPMDTAFFIQGLWNTLHGHFGEQTIYGNFNAFSYHGFFSLLILVPLMEFFQSPLFFCALKNAMVTASAIPIYFVIKQNMENRASRFLLFLCYSLSAFMAAFGYCEAHCQLFAMPVFAASWLFYTKGWFRLFMVSALFCLFTKESFCFVFLAWGLVGWLDGRTVKWILSPALASIAYFTGYHFLNIHLLHFLGRGNVNLYQIYYGQWGNSFPECVSGMLLNPGLFLRQFFNPSNWLFLFYVTFPFLPFLFLRPKLLFLSLPCIGIYFLMGPNDHVIYHPGLIPHYMEVCVFSFIAFVETLAAWKTRVFYRKMTLLCALGLLLTLLACMALQIKLSDYMLFYNLGTHLAGFILCILIWSIFLATISLSAINIQKMILRTTAVAILLTFVFRFAIAHESMICAETYVFNLKSGEVIRNRVARNVLATVPREKSLAVPAKYSIVCSTRPKIDIYNGDQPLSNLKSLSDSRPEYVFLDLLNYFTRFEPVHNDQWDRSPAEAMIADRKNWDVVFYYDHLYLLHRNAQ